MRALQSEEISFFRHRPMIKVHSLLENPYRILGITSDESPEEIARNVALLLKHLKTGEKSEFPTDFSTVLGPVKRDAEALAYAKERLSDVQSRVACAFFWFSSRKLSDTSAYSLLTDGKLDKAEKRYMKQEGYNARINAACVAFMKGDLLGGIGQISSLINSDKDRAEFIRVVGGGELFSCKQLAFLFIRELSRDTRLRDALGLEHIDTEEQADSFLKSILKIHERLAVSVDNIGPMRSMPVMAIKCAVRFLDTTEPMLVSLKEEFGGDAPLCIFVSSWVANEAMSMVVANINFLHTCPPGTETLRTETTKAQAILTRLLSFEVTDNLRGQLENNLKLLQGILDKIEHKHDKGHCYIATMAYGSYDAPQVRILRRFRDRALLTNAPGRAFVRLYYRASPSWVKALKDKPAVNALIRTLLGAFARLYDKLSD